MIRTSTALLAAACLAAAVPAHAVGGRLDVTVVDRDTGQSLQPIAYRGEWWIAGRPGARYGILLKTRDTGRRVLGVVSVDGVNAITGDTAAWDQTGFVVGPYGGFRVDGWQKNADQVAAFTFASLPDSYAARTGRPGNVGVIGVAVFDERVAVVRPLAEADASTNRALRLAPAPAPSAEPAADAKADARADVAAAAPASRERLGTGHGAIESSSITWVAFVRARSSPSEVVTIHYDRLENLVAIGIVPPTRPPVEGGGADPFPGSRRYVPDPPPR